MLAKKCLLVVILTLFSMSLAIADPPAVNPATGEPLMIDCLRGTVTIDGDLSDWNLEAMTPAVLDTVEQLSSGQDVWENVGDCSGEFYMLWDDVNIYMAVVVTDDKLSMNKTDASIWNSDCVEILFSTTNAEAVHSWTNPTIHYQYGFNANNQKWNWCNMDGPGQSEPDYLQIASSVTADGYVLEASIEYAQMSALDFSAGNTIGIHPCIDDTDIDNGDTEYQMSWTGFPAHDQSMGYGHMLLSADSVPVPAPAPEPILKLDVGNSHNTEELEEGFTSFTLDDSGTEVDGITIEFGGINAGDARRRGEPTGVPFENIYRDFIFGRQSESGVGYVSVTLSGLQENQPYLITLYSWDVGSTNTRIADWTANGEVLFTTIHDGSVDPPAAEDDYAYTAVATADANGVILMEAVPGEGTFADQPFAFINALVLVPEPVDPGTDGLVAYFPLDIDALDASGNGNDGILNGDPQWVDGKVDGALEMDGGDYVEVPSAADINPESITLMTWVNFSTVDGADMERQDYLSRGDDYAFSLHEWGYRDGTEAEGKISAIVTSAGGWTVLTGTTLVEPETWYHTTLTYDSGTQMLKLYLDGKVEGDMDLPTGLEHRLGGSLTIGTYNGRDLLGKIDDIKIYNRALSVGEILYLVGFRATVEMDPSLVIYYSFDEVTDIVADQSGKGHDGVVVGDVTAEPQGMYGGAASFANNGYLDLDGANFPAEDIPTSAMTLTAWIKCANTGGDHEIFNARASDETWIMHPEPKSSGDIRWLLRSYGGTTIFQIRNGMMTWDEWLHFAGTYDKDTGKAALYINGELIEEMDVESPADIAGDWDLGARVGLTIDDARPFTGLMDEFRMYTRALSQDEILTIMQGM